MYIAVVGVVQMQRGHSCSCIECMLHSRGNGLHYYTTEKHYLHATLCYQIALMLRILYNLLLIILLSESIKTQAISLYLCSDLMITV